jgi:hypothetical protein
MTASPAADQALHARGTVVALVVDPQDHASQHERATLLECARRVAALTGCDAGGWYDPARSYPGKLYFVPCSTLTTTEAEALGIHGSGDLFGGVVPHAFVATKAISHPLVAPDAAAVPGWSAQLGARLGDTVLEGFTVFRGDDARRAGLQLLAGGAVRVKPVRATGSRGQSVARNPAELQAVLDAVDGVEMEAHGLVLERNLEEVRTFSVGHVCVGGLTATYFGVQKTTRNNEGLEVYGGSDLDVVRGDYDVLLAAALEPEVRHAVDLARRFEAAVRACFPGFHASRSNYDVVVGRDAGGHRHCGVLEQSWRVGGATGPEIAALEAFRADSSCRRVRARGFELFGDSPEPPARASVYFRGKDPRIGLLTKYTVVEGEIDVHAR